MNYHGAFVKANTIIIISSLCVFLLSAFIVLPCYGKSAASKPQALTLKVENMPLDDVLKKISHDTGREIIVNPPWGKVPLTLNFKDIPFEESIRKIIDALGRPSHFIVTNKKDQKVTLLITGLPSGSPAASMGNKTTSPDDKGAILSSDSQIGSLIAAELEAIKAEHKKYWMDLPKDAVIGPPSTSGGPGLTKGQLEAIKKEQENKLEALPSDTIIGPPSTSGGPGLTIGQLEAIKEQQKNQRLLTKDSVIGPPSMSGGPRLTFGQLEAIKKEYEEKRKAQPEAIKIKRPSRSEATENTVSK
jgi:hypothetical protein